MNSVGSRLGKSISGICLLAFASMAQAQHQHTQTDAELKALSAEQVAQYRQGAGMGYAVVAERNRFPGPAHVLELGEKLGLTAQQREAVTRVVEAHKAQAREIGAKLVEAESALEQLFRSGAVGGDALARAVRQAAALQGEYRLSHLDAHRLTRAVLSSEQVTRYDELRGNPTPPTEDELHRH